MGVPQGSPVSLGPGGVFTATLPAPATAGTYGLLAAYTPTGGILSGHDILGSSAGLIAAWHDMWSLQGIHSVIHAFTHGLWREHLHPSASNQSSHSGQAHAGTHMYLGS